MFIHGFTTNNSTSLDQTEQSMNCLNMTLYDRTLQKIILPYLNDQTPYYMTWITHYEFTCHYSTGILYLQFSLLQSSFPPGTVSGWCLVTGCDPRSGRSLLTASTSSKSTSSTGPRRGTAALATLATSEWSGGEEKQGEIWFNFKHWESREEWEQIISADIWIGKSWKNRNKEVVRVATNKFVRCQEITTKNVPKEITRNSVLKVVNLSTFRIFLFSTIS